jgi:hypothetical protein
MSPHSLSMSEKPIAEKPVAHDNAAHEAHPVDVARIVKAFGSKPKAKAKTATMPPSAGTTSNLG